MHTKYFSFHRTLRYANSVFSYIARGIYFEACLSFDHEGPTAGALRRVVQISIYSTALSICALLEPPDIREWSIFSLSFTLTCDCALLFFLVDGAILALQTQVANSTPEVKPAMISDVDLSSLFYSVLALQSGTVAGSMAVSFIELLGRIPGRIALKDDPETMQRSTLWTQPSPLAMFEDFSGNPNKHESSIIFDHARHPIPELRISHADEEECPWPTKNLRDSIVQLCILTIAVLCGESSHSNAVDYTLIGSVTLCMSLWPAQVQAAYATKQWFREIVRLLDGVLAMVYWVVLVHSGVTLFHDTPAPIGLIAICAMHFWLWSTDEWEPDGDILSSEAVESENTGAAYMAV